MTLCLLKTLKNKISCVKKPILLTSERDLKTKRKDRRSLFKFAAFYHRTLLIICNFRKCCVYFIFLFVQVDKAAAGLLALGLKRGDRLGVWGPNTYQWILFQFASAKAGIILVSTGAVYMPLKQLLQNGSLCYQTQSNVSDKDIEPGSCI